MRKDLSKLIALALSGTMLLSACSDGSSVASSEAESSKETAVAESTAETEKVTETETEKETEKETETETEKQTEAAKVDISYDDYSLVWADEFDGDRINEDDWNYELHDPGWVNNELQAYVQSDDNLYTEDGKLVIKPIKDYVGYTSGRINTQGKHDFKYGIMEASIKMPAGQGFLPAFWMMPTDENLYGQWPRCGEIDIAEVLGHDTKTAYGTIHYGNPHSESQGKYTLSNGDFSEEFHNYAVEWLPGVIKWYVDGQLIHEESDWYSATENLGTLTYPAPFDQPFYIILNLAVGGTWPGNPDKTTDFKTASMQVDYVRVYQKDAYDENVEKPVKEVTLRDPNEDGNYINNGTFEEEEDLTDTTDWNFLTALEGRGEAEIKDGAIVVKTDCAGTADYSIQLVHWAVPIQEGAEYKVTFDAWADAERKIKVGVSAPERAWKRYLEDTLVDLTTEKTTYSYNFVMTDSDDPDGRLEFNMGNLNAKDTVYITNVRIEKLSEGNVVDEGKVVLADGNYIYNAAFQEGDKRVGFWSFDADGYEVTALEDGRRLHVTNSALTVSQAELTLSDGVEYMLSFAAEGDSPITVCINNSEYTFDLSDGKGSYSQAFTYTGDEGANEVKFIFPADGEFFLDNVRVEENVMIKNGSFDAGLSGYEVYVDGSASATYVVDSLSEDNAIDFTINNTGTADWKIQLKQNNVKLEKGKTYTLKFDAKSDMKREIRAIMQGGESLGWPVYSTEINAGLTSEYQTFSTTFTMESETNPAAFLSICLGAITGRIITDQHRVCIDNISLVEEE